MTVEQTPDETGTEKNLSLTEKAKANIDEAKAKASGQMASARESATAAYDKTRDKSVKLYEDGKAKANSGYNSSKQAAKSATQKGREQIEKTPMAVVAGGLALGAVIAALVPESEREKKALGSTGRKLNARAKEAADAAKTRGSEKVDELGLSGDALKKQAEELMEKAIEIVKSASKAAGKAATHKD